MGKNPKSILQEWARLMNTHESDKLADLYHSDAVNLQVAVGTPLIGKAAILKDFQDFFRNIPDTFTQVENLFEDGEWAIIEWSGGGTFAPTGKRFTAQGCGFFHIVDGRIKFQRGYWDKHGMFTQMGIPL
jgi:steroid delta-isomerase-like uncharacterized protein